jgi:hypothetical protein
MAPDMGSRRCYAVEVAFEDSEYELAALARVVNDDCRGAPVSIVQGSGVCAFHNQQIRERRRSMQ